MQDDCYLIAVAGWKAEAYRIIEEDKKEREKDRGWACNLIPQGAPRRPLSRQREGS